MARSGTADPFPVVVRAGIAAAAWFAALAGAPSSTRGVTSAAQLASEVRELMVPRVDGVLICCTEAVAWSLWRSSHRWRRGDAESPVVIALSAENRGLTIAVGVSLLWLAVWRFSAFFR